MCIVCVEYEKQKLSLSEALRNLREMKPQLDETHYNEVYYRLIEEQNDASLGEWWEEFGFGD